VEETLTERFNRLTSGMPDAEGAVVMGVTEGAVRKIRRGDTKSFDLGPREDSRKMTLTRKTGP